MLIRKAEMVVIINIVILLLIYVALDSGIDGVGLREYEKDYESTYNALKNDDGSFSGENFERFLEAVDNFEDQRNSDDGLARREDFKKLSRVALNSLIFICFCLTGAYSWKVLLIVRVLLAFAISTVLLIVGSPILGVLSSFAFLGTSLFNERRKAKTEVN